VGIVGTVGQLKLRVVPILRPQASEKRPGNIVGLDLLSQFGVALERSHTQSQDIGSAANHLLG